MSNVRLLVQSYPGLAEIVLPDHRRILAVIRALQPAGAERAMREHLEHARQIRVESIPQQTDERS